MDLIVEVPALDYQELQNSNASPSSAEVQKRVAAARQRQQERLAAVGVAANAQMEARHLRRFCRVSRGGQVLLRQAYTRLNMSLRVHDRLLKVARTIADLEGAEIIQEDHVAEALQYRDRVWE